MGYMPIRSDLEPERRQYVNPARLIEMPPCAKRALDDDPMLQIRLWAARYVRLFATMRAEQNADTGRPYFD